MHVSKLKGFFITCIIILLIGSIYTGVQLFVPNHGLTGYYLSHSVGEDAVLHPIEVSPSEIRPGLNKKVYKGNPKGQLIEEKVEDKPIDFLFHTKEKRTYKSPFTIEWDGLIKIEQDDTYTFTLGSDDGSELFINGKRIINNGGLHRLVEKRQAVYLASGFYRLHLKYFDQGGGAIVYLKWKYSHRQEKVIPLTQFYHETTMNHFPVNDIRTPFTFNIEPNSIINQSYVVFKKNDSAITFNNNGILRTYYVNYWDNDRFKPAVDVPDYNIIWRGYLWIPNTGTYTFQVTTNGNVFLFVDAKPVIQYRTESDSKTQVLFLEKGWKSVQLNYFNPDKYAKLNLLWQRPDDAKPANISSRFLKPTEYTGIFRSAKIWYATGFISAPLIIGLGFLVVFRSKIKKCIQGYSAYVKQNWAIVSIILIVILGAILRLHDYSVVPFHGETMDPYQEVWNGYHILSGEGPKSWEGVTFISAHKNENKKFIRWAGDGFTLVKGYISHPPLFSIFAAIPPIICGAKDFLDCRFTTFNLTPVFFSTLTIILVFLVSFKIYRSNTISIIASLIYATVPLFVASGRLAKGDCLFALALISGVFCILKYIEIQKKKYVIFAGILTGVSFWSKETGICAIIIFPLLLCQKGYVKEACITAGIGLFLDAGYLIHNYLINPEVFVKILSIRSGHHSTKFDFVLRFLKEPKLAMAYAGFGIGYLLWFWFVMVYSMGKRHLTVPITAFIFLMTLCALADYKEVYGWYHMPLYPFLAIAGGVYMRDFISKPHTAKALLILLLLLAVPLKEILPGSLSNAPWLYRYYLALGILPFLAYDFLKHRITNRIAKTTGYVYIALFIMMNVYIVYHLQDIYKPLK